MEIEWVYGVQPVLQVLKAGRRKAKELHIHRTQKGQDIQEVIQWASDCKVPVKQVERISWPGMDPSVLHQGLALRCAPYPYEPIEKLYQLLGRQEQPCLLLILDQIQDPQNLGAILRTAHCAGVGGVILPERGSALLSPTVLKTSAGAAEWLSIYLVKNLARSIEELKEKIVWIYGAEGESKIVYHQEKYPNRCALVLGSEGRGLRHLVKDKCDVLVSIPMEGKINSLNVSVATGVLLYEVLRQRS